MKKITTNFIKKTIHGGTGKQLFAISSLLDLQRAELENSIKKDLEVLSEEEAEEIQKIKNKYAEKKSLVEDKIISKAIMIIAFKNRIFPEKKSEKVLEENEKKSDEKISEVETKVQEENFQTVELDEATRSMEEFTAHPFNSYHNN